MNKNKKQCERSERREKKRLKTRISQAFQFLMIIKQKPVDRVIFFDNSVRSFCKNLYEKKVIKKFKRETKKRKTDLI